MKKLIILFLSFIAAAIITEFKGDVWEEKVRMAFYKITNDSIPNYAAIVTDDKGIPYVHYLELNGVKAGDQYNPTIICSYAIDYYARIKEKNDSAVKVKFLNCINWLADNITYKGTYAIYEFNWQQPFYDSVGVPWTSGMTSGLTMEAFTDAFELYHSPQYLDYAAALLRGFYQPIQSGGFTYKEPTGSWYEEYADPRMHTPRVLDGHIYTFLGVYKFWQLTKNDSALYVVRQGISSLKTHLPRYDIGNGWSYYDAYHTLSDKRYHMLLTSLMKKLWGITKDPVFNFYYHKWESPLTKPYIYRIIKEKNRSGLVLYFLLSGLFFAILYLVYRGIIRLKPGK